ncbi:Interleukin-2 receptor subunit alpha [Trichinella pseudospiralis]
MKANNRRQEVKLMKQKKVKTRTTPSKSRMAFRRTRNEKSTFIQIKRMKQRKRENADDVKQITDGALTNKTCEEANGVRRMSNGVFSAMADEESQ